MSTQVYEYSVAMTCGGCANAVNNVLNKKEGVDEVKIDLEEKKVFVTTKLSAEEITKTIEKTGKACQFIQVQK